MDDLFGTSGVRGIVNKEVDCKLALNLARSLSSLVENDGEVLIGRDTRLSGEMFENSLIAGFASSGINVGRLGIVPTPVVGFSVLECRADAGLMITASHNPPEYNGVKFFDSDGTAFSAEKEREIERAYRDGNFTGNWNSIGSVRDCEFLDDYLEYMSDKISLERDYKVVVDCANGPTARTTPALLGKLGCETITLNSHNDGRFCGRKPEPSEDNLRDLCNMVGSIDADLGIAHDGDGDRVAAVDENGRMVNEDQLLALISAFSIERFGRGVVTTVDASKVIDEQVKEVGGKVWRTEVGDVNVAQEMKIRGVSFGGEPSGTWILGDVHMCPDGTLAAARILEMMYEHETPLSKLIGDIPHYPVLREKIECSDEKKEAKMIEVKEEAKSAFSGIRDILTIDGIRLELADGDWILIRPSGTEPYIRVTVEASDNDKAEFLLDTAVKVLR